MSEYDPLLADEESDDLAEVEELFAGASAPYLGFPWSWLAWAVLLPAASLATRPALAAGGAAAAALTWSAAILVGGAVELTGIRRTRGRLGATPLAAWVLRAQGNLSLVALALSLAVIVAGRPLLLPGLWLLLLGHSLFTLGGLAYPPFRAAGILYQLGGAAALWPALLDPFHAFAVTTAAGNLLLFWSVLRSARQGAIGFR
jgi:hypothetical protein